MKWEAADFRVGLAVLGAIAILIGTALWLSPTITDPAQPLYTEYDRIDGIATQADVMLSGYRVGRVSDIRPVIRDDGSLAFRVRMQVNWTLDDGRPLPVREGTRARLVTPFPIGAGYIALEVPTTGERLSPGATVSGVRAGATVDQMQTMAERITGEVTQTLVTARDVARDLSKTMVTARALMDTLTSTARVVERGATVAADALPTLLAGMQRELNLADSLLQELRPLGPAARASLDSANRLMGDSRRAINELTKAMGTNGPKVEAIMANLDTTTRLLTHFSREVSRRPLKVLTGVGESPKP